MLLRKSSQRMHCSRSVGFQRLCAQGGDYLLPVKANQLEVLEAIESQFRKPTDATDFQTAYEVWQIEHQQDGENLLPSNLDVWKLV